VVCGLEGQRLLLTGHGLFEPITIFQGIAKIAEHTGIVGIERECPLIARDGGRKAPQGTQEHAEISPHAGVIRMFQQVLLIRRQGFV
jgi:hypothetical protein